MGFNSGFKGLNSKLIFVQIDYVGNLSLDEDNTKMDLTQPNSMIEWISPLLRTGEVQGSRMGPNTGYTEFLSITPDKL